MTETQNFLQETLLLDILSYVHGILNEKSSKLLLKHWKQQKQLKILATIGFRSN